jgi:transposase-like protein
MSDHTPIRTRRSYTTAFRLQLIAETRHPGASIAAVARRHGLNANVLFGWLRDPRYNGKVETPAFLPVETRPAPLLRAPSSSDRLDLMVELPGGVRIVCRDERGLIAVLRAARQAT